MRLGIGSRGSRGVVPVTTRCDARPRIAPTAMSRRCATGPGSGAPMGPSVQAWSCGRAAPRGLVSDNPDVDWWPSRMSGDGQDRSSARPVATPVYLSWSRTPAPAACAGCWSSSPATTVFASCGPIASAADPRPPPPPQTAAVKRNPPDRSRSLTRPGASTPPKANAP